MTIVRRDFFLGFGTGIAVTILLLIAASAGLIFITKRATRNLQNNETALYVLHFPQELTNYGEPDWNWTLLTLDGKEHSFSEFQGKVVFVNFWATWCEPCRAELPTIQKLFDRLKGEPVAVILISDEDAETVGSYIAKGHFSFPVYMAHEGRPRVFQDPGIPVTFVLSQSGMVVFKQEGAFDWSSDTTVDFLQSLTKKSS